MKKKKMIDFKNAYRGVVGIFVLICVVIGFLCYTYYSSLSTTIKDESKAYLKELSNRIVADVERIINDNVAVLNTMAASIEEIGKTSSLEINTLLNKQKSHFNYEEIYLIDKNGKAYGGSDGLVFLNLDESVRSNILMGIPSMSTAQIINNKEYILFSVPVSGYALDGNEIVALLGCYNAESFNNVLSMTSFDELAYSQIVTKTGTIVTRPNSEHEIKGGYNVLSTLKSSKMGNGFSVEQLQKDMNSDVENQLIFTMDDISRYLIYTPLEQNNWYLFTFVPVSAVNQKSDVLMRMTLIICGLITLAFSAMVATLVYIFNKHRGRLEKLAYVDPVTDGNTIQRFYIDAESIFNKYPEKQFALVYINVEKFKVLNEQLGRATCDKILKFLSSLFGRLLADNESVSRLFADNFCMLIEYKDEEAMLSRLLYWYEEAEKTAHESQIKWALPTLQMGIYVIHDKNLPFEQMIDRAKLGLKETSWAVDNKLRYGFYDDEVRRILFREKQIEDRMLDALNNNEFKVFLQPKYSLPDESIGGAEALVRWQTEDEGMIYPNEFIPLFEKNGFIVQLDLWVFEEVCKSLEKWVKKGHKPVKISVNCSRIHFKDPAFLRRYTNIADKYSIDRNLLEIELTESVVMENSERLTKIISDIKGAGFGCSMDDFGSGYSSLNMLQSIPVDTLKLDRIFFNNNYEPKRTEALIKSIVLMAQSLKMETVAEGVEIREQVEMLKRAGCNYIQGYVFAKPMPTESFEQLAFFN